MNMILVRTNIQEPNLVSFCDFPARLRQNLVDRIGDYHPTVFRTTEQMVQKHRYIWLLCINLLFCDIESQNTNNKRGKPRGIKPSRD